MGAGSTTNPLWRYYDCWRSNALAAEIGGVREFAFVTYLEETIFFFFFLPFFFFREAGDGWRGLGLYHRPPVMRCRFGAGFPRCLCHVQQWLRINPRMTGEIWRAFTRRLTEAYTGRWRWRLHARDEPLSTHRSLFAHRAHRAEAARLESLRPSVRCRQLQSLKAPDRSDDHRRYGTLFTSGQTRPIGEVHFSRSVR